MRSGAYRFGEFDLHPGERQLHRLQQPVALPPQAFDALLLFVQNAEHLVHRDRLMQTLWPDTSAADASLTTVIVALRTILGRQAIQTVSKFGYRFTLRVVAEPGIDHTVYATFLQARELALLRSIESTTRARDLLALCVAEDPSFATAWAWLGRCCRRLDKLQPEPSADLGLAQAAFRRALAIDPHLACAHHFYTQLQVDLGQSHEAMVRLVHRIRERGDEPESYAGLVHALRFCGLLEESIRADAYATALDPTTVTTVPHTHFLRCDYDAAIDAYGATRYYLDAAAWAALGDTARACALLRERLAATDLSALMSGLMGSLLDALEGRRDEALVRILDAHVEHEPEAVFYLARHLAMIGAAETAIRFLQRAREEGFTASHALLYDAAFAPLRGKTAFQREVDEAEEAERASRLAFEHAGGRQLASQLNSDSTAANSPGRGGKRQASSAAI